MNDKLPAMIAASDIILLDGALGTMLIEGGLRQGESPEDMNITYPETVRSVHRQYIQAGSQVILTNSFGGNRFRLKRHQLDHRVAELNLAAARLARLEADAVPFPVIVAGSMGPTGELFEPMGAMTHEQARSAFAEQAAALAEGGVDALWVETASDLAEVKAAIEGIRSVTGLPVAVTMSFDRHGRTMMGVDPAQAFAALRSEDLVAVGANCGRDPEEIESAIAAMHAEDPNFTLIAKANAGIPQLVEGELVYAGTPAIMADYAIRVRERGAKLIGACCGSTPEHIRAMGEALGLAAAK